jgi:glyoxylase-like metal-dependent hydrolase (beta-lactamase superfamily II)
MVTKPRPRSTCGAAAFRISITRSRWRRRCPRTELPVIHLRHGALVRLFPVASTHCRVSNSLNTTSSSPRTGNSSSASTPARVRILQKGAYEALRAYAPGLPPLTTVFMTHAHWDHVGGHSYFRGLNPHPRFYGRGNYQEEFEREFNGPEIFAKQFFGERFSSEEVLSYKPDIAIDNRTDLDIGGSKVELIPVRGGETHDAMLIHLPDEKVVFMGDVIMPYLGAPFAEEGDLGGLLDAIDVVVSRNPQYLLHGHEPLTRNFTSTQILIHLKTDLAWLREQVLTAIRRGDERAVIHESNLIPPDFLANQPDAYQPYYIMREHVIDRIYDQNVGYWEANLQGLAHPGRMDRAELLVDYLGLSEAQIVKAADRLCADGKYEMAAALVESANVKFPGSDSLKRVKRFAYLKLMEKNQNTDPFKFIIYSGNIGEQTPQINAEDAKQTRGATR